MRADKLVYLLLQLAPQGFFSLIGRSPDDASRYDSNPSNNAHPSRSVEQKDLEE